MVTGTVSINMVCEKFDFKYKTSNRFVSETVSLCEVKINAPPKKEMLLDVSCVVWIKLIHEGLLPVRLKCGCFLESLLVLDCVCARARAVIFIINHTSTAANAWFHSPLHLCVSKLFPVLKVALSMKPIFDRFPSRLSRYTQCITGDMKCWQGQRVTVG